MFTFGLKLVRTATSGKKLVSAGFRNMGKVWNKDGMAFCTKL